MPKEFRSLIPLDEAKSIVLSHLPRTTAEDVPLERAWRRILAEKVISYLDVPGFHRASMDGYAVHSQDTIESREDRPVTLRLAGSVPMGVLPDLHVGCGEAAEVSTGSMMPPGADAVVMIEYSQTKKDQVLIHRPVYYGENVQSAGSDISFGESMLFPGTMLAAREIGVLAALGRQKVKVRHLKVGLASTGNELRPSGEKLGPGQIYDINTHAIATAVQECGANAILYGILPDIQEEMADALLQMANKCDMILVSGSTSAGAGDMVYQVLEKIGELIFHGVNLKPGKPTIFGLINEKPFLGLPGYPTSALTVFSKLAAPVIRKTLGRAYRESKITGVLAGPIRTEGRHQMLAVGISRGKVYPVDKGSGSITTLALADGIIEIPAGLEYLERGETVEVELFREQEMPDLVVAGENSLILEKIAEDLTWRLLTLNTGSLRGRIYLEDGVADLACVSGLEAAPPGLKIYAGYKRELGLVFRNIQAIQEIRSMRVIGWNLDSLLKANFEQTLSEMDLTHPNYVRFARTHSSVAAAIASGRADIGFCERTAAVEAGLGFKFVKEDFLHFIGKPEMEINPCVVPFINSLPV